MSPFGIYGVPLIVGLLSFYDELPEQLAACVSAAATVCGQLVAVDGAYALWPQARARSPLAQTQALVAAADTAGVGLLLYQPPQPWPDNEVGKRAFMFELGRTVSREYRDWFLVVDADEFVEGDRDRLEAALASTPLDVGWATLKTVHADSDGSIAHGARRLFRAIPELTVIGTHWYYVGRSHGRRVILWGNERLHPVEPTLDVRALLTIEHRKLIRTTGRDAQRGAFDRHRRLVERLPRDVLKDDRRTR